MLQLFVRKHDMPLTQTGDANLCTSFVKFSTIASETALALHELRSSYAT